MKFQKLTQGVLSCVKSKYFLFSLPNFIPIQRLLAHINNKYVWWSIATSLLLLVLNYFVNNLPIFTKENMLQQHITQRICEALDVEKRINYDDAIFINVSYDKDTVSAYEKEGDYTNWVGNTAITDREKLYQFLERLNDRGKYKYIILDLLFDSCDVSKHDNKLFDLLGRMKNIVVVDFDNISKRYPALADKVGIAEYYSTIIDTNFGRYEYIRTDSAGNDQRYISLKVFESLNDSLRFKRMGWSWLSIYTSGGKLCNNCVFLTFDSYDFKANKNAQKFNGFTVTKNNVINLGSDFTRYIDNPKFKPQVLERKIKNIDDKYVIIGNIQEDLHDTYLGLKPGSLILYRALQSLEEGLHLITGDYLITWFFIYFIITLFICTGTTVIGVVKKFIKWLLSSKSFSMFDKPFFDFLRKPIFRIGSYLVDTLSFTVFLSICQIAEYLLCNTVHSIALPVYVFGFLRLAFHYKEYRVQ